MRKTHPPPRPEREPCRLTTLHRARAPAPPPPRAGALRPNHPPPGTAPAPAPAHAHGGSALTSVASTSGSAVVPVALPAPPWRPGRVLVAGRSASRPRYWCSLGGAACGKLGELWGSLVGLGPVSVEAEAEGSEPAHSLGGPGPGDSCQPFTRHCRELPSACRGGGTVPLRPLVTFRAGWGGVVCR